MIANVCFSNRSRLKKTVATSPQKKFCVHNIAEKRTVGQTDLNCRQLQIFFQKFTEKKEKSLTASLILRNLAVEKRTSEQNSHEK